MPFHAIYDAVRDQEITYAEHEHFVARSAEQFVDGQISTGRYSSVSEYVRELIRADEKRKADDKLEASLLEGMVGTETKLTPADWKAIRKEALAKLDARKQKR